MSRSTTNDERILLLRHVGNYVVHVSEWNSLTVVRVQVARAADEEVVVDHQVDRLGHENHLVLMTFVTNVEVREKRRKEQREKEMSSSCLGGDEEDDHRSLSLCSNQLKIECLCLDRGHYAYDCEIRLRRQRRLR